MILLSFLKWISTLIPLLLFSSSSVNRGFLILQNSQNLLNLYTILVILKMKVTTNSTDYVESD